MDDLKVYTPTEIEDTPFPQEGDAILATSQQTAGGNYSPKTTKDIDFPDLRVAFELLSSSLNTRSKKILSAFEFTPSGALQIGKYQQGESGDIRISPNGIVARNDLGNQTFVLDGDTGDAIFAGTIQSGTLIAGRVVIGNNTWIIDGNSVTPQMVLYNNDLPNILIGERG